MEAVSRRTSRACVLALAVCVAVGALAGCTGRSEQARIQGDGYASLGKHAEAEAKYREAIEAEPGNAMAYLGLGRSLLAQDKVDDALASLKKAYETDPGLEAAYDEAAGLLAEKGQTAEALGVAEALAAQDAGKGAVLRARVLMRAGRADEAVATLEGLSSADAVMLAVAYLEAGRPADAEEAVGSIAESTGADAVAARFVKADAAAAQGRAEEALAEVEQALAAEPNNAVLKLQRALSLVNAGRVDEAEQAANEVLTADGQSPWARFVLARCYRARGQEADAAAALRRLRSDLPDEALLAREMAGTAATAPVTAEAGSSETPAKPKETGAVAAVPTLPTAGKTWQELWKEGAVASLLHRQEELLATGDPACIEALTLSALFTRNVPRAEELAKKLPADSKVSEFFEVVKAGRLPDTVKWFDSWMEEETDRQVVRENVFAYALANGGARSRAIRILLDTSKAAPEYGVSLVNVAQVFRETRMPKFATGALQALLQQYPDNFDAHALLFRVLREGELTQEARSAAEATYAIFPDSKEACLNLSQAYLDTDDPAAAIDILTTALERQPDDREIALALAWTYIKDGRLDDAAKELEKQAPRHPDDPVVGLYQALCAALSGDWTGVDAAGAGVDTANMSLPLRFVKAGGAAKAGDPERAAGYLTVVKEGEETSAPGRVAGILLQALGQAQEGLEESDAALAKSLEGRTELVATYALGAACQTAQLHDRAFELLKGLGEQVPPNVSLTQLAFASLSRAGKVADPVGEAQGLAQRHPNDSGAWLAVARVARERENAEAERQALDRAKEVGADNPEVFFQRGVYWEKQGNLPNAVAEYRQLVELRPDNPVAHNNLAYCLLMSGGDPKEAMASALKASEKLGNDPHVLHTLGVAQLRAGELEESRKNLAVALEIMPCDPTLLLDYGQLLLKQNDVQGGAVHIASALQYAEQLTLDFPRRAEAEAILREIVKRAPQPGPKRPERRESGSAA